MLNELLVGQVVALSRQGAAAGEIASELGVDEPLVRLALRANGVGTESDRDINDAQLEIIRKRLYNAVLSNDDYLATKVGMFLLERDKPRAAVGSGANIQAINIAITQANGEMERLKETYKTA